MDVQRVYYLRLFNDHLTFLIMVLLKAFQLHLYVLLGSSIPTEIIQFILFVFVDLYISKKSIACGCEHTLILCNSTLFKFDKGKIKIELKSISQIFAGHDSSFIIKDQKLYKDRTNYFMDSLESHEYKDNDFYFREIFMSKEITKKTSFKDGEKITNETYDYQPFNGLKSISCGYKCVFIITKEGLFVCGKNACGQLGIGSQVKKVQGLKKIKLNNVISISCGFKFTMALTKEGLFSCGENRYGQLGTQIGYGSTYSFIKIHIQNVIMVECGYEHTLVLTVDGLYACGIYHAIRAFFDCDHGVLKYHTTCSKFQKGPIDNVVSFKCGYNFSLILTHDGLFGCGTNEFNIDNYNIDIFNKINIDNVISFDCGFHFSIIETTDGFFGCGEGINKQLLIKNKPEKNTFVKIM